MGKRVGVGLSLTLGLLLAGGPSTAKEFLLGGKPARVMGYINQGAAFGIAGDHFDTKEGFQQAVFDSLLEGEYRPTPNLKFFVAGKFTADWAYPLLRNNNEWKDKRFDDSEDELFIDTGWRKMLQEAHVTWTPGRFSFRAGKQIVKWGETDGFRLMDQINPQDNRRGLGDVEFESTVIPIWLLKSEFYLQPQSSWLQDVGLEVVLNPNADFQRNRAIVPGNDVAGIWAANIDLGLIPVAFDPVTGAPLAFLPARLGSLDTRLDEPDRWDPEGMEVGTRIRAVVNDAIVTLNYYNGLEKDPLRRPLPLPPGVEVASDGALVIHPVMEGDFPRFRLVGATFTRDFPTLTSSLLGGVAPVLRLEGFYGLRNTFQLDSGERVQKNEIRYVVGVDWKIKANFLNPRAYFFLSGQFFHQRLLDFPSESITDKLTSASGGPLEEDNYMTSLLVNTSYFHNKIAPMFFWLRDITNNANMFKAQVTYDRSDKWDYTLGALMLDGQRAGLGLEPLKHKDQVFFTVRYRFQ